MGRGRKGNGKSKDEFTPHLPTIPLPTIPPPTTYYSLS
jgi:hypothetical protein